MYKVSQSNHPIIKVISILRSEDNACIPTNPANTDYANFKKAILAETAQLQNAEGATMSAAAAKEFVATLP